MNKLWYTYNYSALKRNEVLIHATTWVNLENVTLSEKSQTQKVSHCMIPFIWNIQKRKADWWFPGQGQRIRK